MRLRRQIDFALQPLTPTELRSLQIQNGFTLIELMITVAIVAILASIAYPSYRDSVLKGRRAEARSALLDLMQQQERSMTARGSYTSFTGNASVAFKNYSGGNRASSAYLIAATDCDGGVDPTKLRTCVLLTATPVATDPQVTSIGIRSTGQKICTTSNGTSTTTLAPCW